MNLHYAQSKRFARLRTTYEVRCDTVSLTRQHQGVAVTLHLIPCICPAWAAEEMPS